ncbi:GspMb/PilO family protein [Massilia sp. CMS3.1]|uniref:GspMb/PilO family protein n=1 Tax=Massilia sp. CMS3.1 TaxID=3373083 RepID=UPI003EE5F803
MNAALIRKAAALPARQLHLMGAGLLLIVAAALWLYALRAPLAALRAVRAEQAQLELLGSDPRLLAAQLAVLGTDNDALVKRLGATPAQPPAQLLVRLVGELGALAQAQGVTLHGVSPAPDEMVLAFTQAGFDADVSGPYANLLAWMSAIERAQPNLAIAGFEMRPAETPGQVVMKIRIAAFRPQESTP